MKQQTGLDTRSNIGVAMADQYSGDMLVQLMGMVNNPALRHISNERINIPIEVLDNARRMVLPEGQEIASLSPLRAAMLNLIDRMSDEKQDQAQIFAAMVEVGKLSPKVPTDAKAVGLAAFLMHDPSPADRDDLE
jgi:hypothetical protein